MNVTILHNPRCSKSRSTLAILQDQDCDITIREYLKSPLSKKELKEVLKKLNLDARAILRKSEEAYKALNLSDTELSNEKLIDAIVEHPKLMERPIVIAGDNAVIGRPPENVHTLLK